MNFKYHPNCAESRIFTKAEPGSPAVCQCCGRETEYYYNTMYSAEDVNCLCPDCIASGAAAEKFSGEFIQDAEEGVDDQAQIAEWHKAREHDKIRDAVFFIIQRVVESIRR